MVRQAHHERPLTLSLSKGVAVVRQAHHERDYLARRDWGKGMMRNRLALSLATTIVVTACGAPQAPSGSAERPTGAVESAGPSRLLVMAARNEPASVAAKPLRFVASQGSTLAMFNATLDFVDERNNAHPRLAEAVPQLNTDTWRVFPDGRMQTTYRLKPDLVWHDGAALSAEDFVFAWKIYGAPEFGVARTLPLPQMEELEAPDPSTLIIRWRGLYPDAAVLRETFQALPRHILEPLSQQLDAESFTNHPFWSREYVGLGAYKMDRWEPGAFFEGVAFDRYVQGRPKIDRMQVRFILDPNTALANLLADEVHMAIDFAVRFEQGTVLDQEWGPRQGGTVLYSPTLFWRTYFQFRPEIATPKSILDVRVRRALAHAIDRPSINEALMGGRATLSDSSIYPQEEFYPAIERAITKYPFDLRRAQQRLEEAGFVKGGDGFYLSSDGEVLAPPVSTTAAPAQESENAIIVETFRRAGIAATSHIIPARLQQDGQTRSTFPAMQTGGGGGGERGMGEYVTSAISGPDNRWTGRNRGGWSHREFDRIWEAFSTTLEPSERVARIAELHQIQSEEIPVIPHFFNMQITPHVAALRGPLACVVPDAASEVFNIHLWTWR